MSYEIFRSLVALVAAILALGAAWNAAERGDMAKVVIWIVVWHSFVTGAGHA